MVQQDSGAPVAPDPQAVLAWAQFYAYTMGWVVQPIHKFMGLDPQSGRSICSCELTGKKWSNCNEAKPGKHPWKGWKQAPMDTPDQGYNTFFSVWQQYPHGVNIGVRTGQVSDIWAIDIDVGGAKNGIVDVQQWLEKNQMDWATDLATLSALTGGGGYHYVFKYPPGVDKIPTVAPHADIGPSVDIKGDGGYILVEPSMHTSGNVYKWREEINPDMVRLAPVKIIGVVQKKKRTGGVVDISYTPSIQELKDYADELVRKKSSRAKDVGKNMVMALGGAPIAEEGGAHDAYRDIMYFVAKRWPKCDPKEILEHFQDSVAERFAHKDDASTDMSNLMDSMYTALEKANEEAASWLGQIAMNDAGRPTATDANLLLYFKNHPAWQGVLGYDQRFNKAAYLKKPPIPTGNGVVDLSRDKSEITLWFQARAQMVGKISRDDVLASITSASWVQPFDPLQEMVKKVQGTWDGKPRLQTALQRVAGSPDTEWVRTVFPLWMKSLCARILWPGCKVDTMLILEGKQGYKKSTFFSSLLPESRFFSDSLAKVSHNVESIRLVHSGPAIFELGELSGLRKQEVEDIKAFLSAQEDDLRPLYESPRKALRRCIFVGTTNRQDYLRDETGNRRFWPIEVRSNIDVQTTLAEREQWFAEALHGLANDETWWLPNGRAESLAQVEQDARYEEDIWHQPIADWLANEATESPESANSATEQMSAEMNKQKAGQIVTTAQVAEYALKVEMKNAKSGEGIRINKILRILTWVPIRFEDIDKKRKRGWKRPGTSIDVLGTPRGTSNKIL